VAALDEMVPFIEGDALAAGAEDAYNVPRTAPEVATLFEHCARAIDARLDVGVNGLPLIGAGDWNDGMNQVGVNGRGESVWLGWFLCRVVADFAPLAEARGEALRATRWRTAAHGWRQALEGPAWDGRWYARAFFDDGSALGTHSGAECRIDLIAQAWSVLSDVAPPERQRQAMASAEQALFDPEWRLLRLLDPPLAQHSPSAGYIQAYPPGVRENGGQYTHAAVWAAMAWAQLGQVDAAWRAWVACSPAHRAADPELSPRFGLEPYAVAADICSQPPWTGRGGWNWYSGSAAGLYRAAVGSICGLQVLGDRLRFMPALPSHWPAVHLTLRRGGRMLRFSLCRIDATQEMATIRALGARPLPIGEWLALSGGEDEATAYLVELPAVSSR
jgi:cyclic beta-1,2-glucan synthetase